MKGEVRRGGEGKLEDLSDAGKRKRNEDGGNEKGEARRGGEGELEDLSDAGKRKRNEEGGNVQGEARRGGEGKLEDLSDAGKRKRNEEGGNVQGEARRGGEGKLEDLSDAVRSCLDWSAHLIPHAAAKNNFIPTCTSRSVRSETPGVDQPRPLRWEHRDDQSFDAGATMLALGARSPVAAHTGVRDVADTTRSESARAVPVASCNAGTIRAAISSIPLREAFTLTSELIARSRFAPVKARNLDGFTNSKKKGPLPPVDRLQSVCFSSMEPECSTRAAQTWYLVTRRHH